MLSAIVAVTCGHPVTHKGDHVAVGHIIFCRQCDANTCVTAVMCVHEMTEQQNGARQSRAVDFTVIDASLLASHEYDATRRWLIRTRTDKPHLRLHYDNTERWGPWRVRRQDDRTAPWHSSSSALEQARRYWF